MTDDPDRRDDALDSRDPDAPSVGRLLADPVVWTELPPGLEDEIVAAIAAEAGAGTGDRAPHDGTHGVVAIGDARPTAPTSSDVGRTTPARRWLPPIAAGIAAAILLVVGFAVVTRESGDVDVEVAMTPTDLAPEAAAQVGIETTPNGTRLVLDVSGLPPAPEGTVYEAWLRQSPEVGVSAGTFHLRGGPGELELWAGVDIADYPLVTVTIQDEGDPVSSGRVVLRAEVDR